MVLLKVYEVYCNILTLGSQANPPKTIKPIHAEFDRCLSTSLSLVIIKRKGESLQDLRGLQTATGCGQLIIAHLCTSLPSSFSPLLAMLFFQAVSIITSPSLRPLHPFLAYSLFSLFRMSFRLIVICLCLPSIFILSAEKSFKGPMCNLVVLQTCLLA